MNEQTLSIRPTQPAERIQLLDVLRGFALFGILLVNMDYFIHPFQTILLPLPETVAGIDRAVAWFVKFIAEGKFYSIFSFLFGYGFTMMMMRSEVNQTNFLPIISRRYIVLFIIGLVHAFFIWVGDILALYSLLGFVLILFRKAKPKTLIIWVIVLLAIPLILLLFGAAAIELGKSVPQGREEIEKSFAQQEAMYKKDIDRAYEVYSTGNFGEIIEQRAYDMRFMSFATIFIGPSVFAMFLIGMYFGKRQILQNLTSNIQLFKKIFWWGLIIGVIGNFVYATLILPLPRFEPTFTLFIASFGQVVGAPALSLFFIAAFALLLNSNQNNNWLNYLAAPGRMALSSYFMQSIICTLIFYGYGLGLFGKVGKVTGLILVIVIYGSQIFITNWWMKKFQYGPAEWLWRWLTYLNKPEMKRR
ncbi:MAG: DUF418 domain-containing protein [Bacteroidota bacterium]|nr:DUF418 domain-containing protein [Bacteroidota bacterium]